MDKFLVKNEAASEDELKFIKTNMPKGMVKMVMIRTEKTRMQVLYQLVQSPKNQDPEIINAFREILYAITRKQFPENK